MAGTKQIHRYIVDIHMPYINLVTKDITIESRYNSETTLYCKVKYTRKDDKL